MKIRICPRCNKVVYINTKRLYPLCLYCGYAFNERRIFYRIEKAANVFFFGDVPQKAKTKDVSGKGIKVAYTGKPFEQDAVLSFKIEGSVARKSAKVVWSKRIGNKKSESGLRFISKRGRSKS